MRSTAAHLATLSLAEEALQDHELEATPAKVEAEHPLALELRQAIENPETTTVGTYARLVERLLGELSVGDGQLDTIGDPVTPRLADSMPKRPYVPMTPEEQSRIVGFFVERQWNMSRRWS